MDSKFYTASTQVKQNLTRRSAGILRFGLVFLVVVAQVAVIFFLVQVVHTRALPLYFIIQGIAVIDIFILTGKRQNASFTMAWVILILLLPVSGHILYILWGRRTKHKRIRRTLARTNPYLVKDPAVYQALSEAHPRRKRLAGYLGRMGFPAYQGTSCTYYPLGDVQFPAMLADIEQAKKFIFLEYFIIGQGELWTELREILARKAAEGVEVRVMYDDFGSLITLPRNLEADLKSLGIQVTAWGPIHYSISRLYINYRNHQKICVIDGDIAYTGGTNLADEYINVNSKLGHWKDTAIRIEGDAVWSHTVFFLQMWEAQTKQEQDLDKYRPTRQGKAAPGFYQPFSDGPMNNPYNPAEITYRSMVNNAREYVYITSPYLIIDNSMTDALCTAALGGTDVRIITPRKWDRWFVHMATQSNYDALLRAGVKLYEYAPGYIHAKTILSDDDHCIIGTINMDYRSFYLHYENAVWMCGTPVIKTIKADFERTLLECEEIELAKWQKRPWRMRLYQSFFRIFAIFF
ncbi:MAG: cardiolipin synthase [Oscillospiraceae bacterium]|nr:cardiolipin synthase [Oscillospiraceae bacterium]